MDYEKINSDKDDTATSAFEVIEGELREIPPNMESTSKNINGGTDTP